MAGNQNSGRRALPTNVHLLRGNPSKKSAAELRGTPAVSLEAKMPPCPAFLTADARAEWRRIAADLKTLGMIASVDRAELAVYCQAWADWKMARERLAEESDRRDGGYVDVTPKGFQQMGVWLQLANRAEERMRAAGASFGFSPSARARAGVQVAAQGELFENEQTRVANTYF
jgi:P27 family predicted phage terminase small subunit